MFVVSVANFSSPREREHGALGVAHTRHRGRKVQSMSDYGMVSMGRDAVSSVYSWLLSLCCSVGCTTTNITINKRQLRVVRQLAEGGFSFVYLVEGGGEKFALKKVLSQLPEQAEAAQWEIKVHSAFQHKNCMPLIDHCVVPAANGAEEFRLLMPLYAHGTLLDRCVALMEKGQRLPEKVALKIFEGILNGVAQFHDHEPAWAHRCARWRSIDRRARTESRARHARAPPTHSLPYHTTQYNTIQHNTPQHHIRIHGRALAHL